MKKRSSYIAILLLISAFVWGTPCDRPDIEAAYKILYGAIDAQESSKAIHLADSLLKIMVEENLTECPTYYWIQYERGEALEMVKNKQQDALKVYYALIKECEKNENWELMAEAYISIARIHETIGRPKDCLRNLNIARNIIIKHQLHSVFSRFAVRNASYQRIYDNKDSASIYALLAIEFGKRYDVQRSILDGNLLMGIVTNQIDSSVYYFQEATEIYLQRKSYYGAAMQKANIATRYLKGGNILNAQLQLDTAFIFAYQMTENNTGYYRILSILYETQKDIYQTEGNIDSAYFYSQKSLEAGNQADIRIDQKEISEQEITFALEKEKAKLELEQQRSRYLTIGLIFVVLFFITMILAYIDNLGKKRFIAKQKDQITSQNFELNQALNQQSVLLSEIHHRVKNNLQLVMSLLTLKGSKSDSKEVQSQFEDIANKVQSIALIHEQLYQSGEFEKVDTNTYFKNLSNHFKELQNETDQFKIELNIDDITLNLETVMPLGIIFAELISNSIKYGRQKNRQLEIMVNLGRIKDQFVFYYKDNGPGFKKGKLEAKSKSMGSLLINSMVRQLKANGTSSNDDGAVFSMFFKEKQVSGV